MFQVETFSQFAGNRKCIVQAKTELLEHKYITVVGDVRSGKSSFLRCITSHFSKKASFHHMSKNIESENEFTKSVENFMRRKVDVTKLCTMSDDGDTDLNLPRYIIIDDLDILLAYDTRSIFNSIAAAMKLGCRFVFALDKDSARKYKLKKDSLMIYLEDRIETNDMKKWVKLWFPDALTNDDSEAGLCKAMRAVEAANGSMRDMLDHFYVVPTDFDAGKGIQWDRDGNYKSIERIYTQDLSFDDLYNAAESTGGSMLWQIAWQNSKLYSAAKKDAYLARMLNMIDGVDLEFQGHMGKDRHANCIGTALAISSWSGLAPKVDMRKLEYSKTIGNGGARALDKKNLAVKAFANNVTLCEMSRVINM